ncbi:hypothetical protein [Paraferrimonas haliotis]|uniref:Uncharacterized protein n=1 Tax=Paraferrimonas haliotis TaxID=2013866 RepID=A0AA37TN15_9GAMM|nr:hypothetical protein [Paraferrimonas haliotis]GLS82748.1 hypothetical protein GCM10007894_07250 [Paraferrimonas haliotis]
MSSFLGKASSVIWIVAGLIVIVLSALHIKNSHSNIELSCRNSVLEANPDDGALHKYAMVANFSLQGRSARISYRYYSLTGQPLVTLSMRGKIKSANHGTGTYVLSLTDSDIQNYQNHTEQPLHALHLAEFSNRNINNNGAHSLTIQLVKALGKNQVLLHFLPSTNLCICSLSQT